MGKGREVKTEKSKLKNLSSLLAFLFFTLALLAKPMAVTFPFVLLLLDFWPLRRWSFGGRASRRAETMIPLPPHGRSCRALFLEKIPFFLLAAASSRITYVAQKQSGAVRSLSTFSIADRIGNGLVGYVRYLGKTIWPTALSVFYPHPGHTPVILPIASAVVVIGICVVAVRFGSRYPFLFVGWFWFLGMLVPTIGLVQVGEQSIADRYMYLPMVGLLIAVAWGFSEATIRWPVLRHSITATAGLVVGLYGIATQIQLAHWQTSETLFRHALAVTERNCVAHNHLGTALLDRGQIDQAIHHFRAAARIDSTDPETENNLGNALLAKGQTDEAIDHFRAAIRIEPEFADAYYNLGNVFMQKANRTMRSERSEDRFRSVRIRRRLTTTSATRCSRKETFCPRLRNIGRRSSSAQSWWCRITTWEPPCCERDKSTPRSISSGRLSRCSPTAPMPATTSAGHSARPAIPTKPSST